MVTAATYAKAKALTSFFSLLSVLVGLASSTALQRVLISLFHPRRHPIRFAALTLSTVLNIKSAPLAWTFRFFRICWYQIYLQRAVLPPPTSRITPQSSNLSRETKLFLPVITTSMYTPLLECDYNGHKSNSTYFTDLDMARTQLVSCLLRKGIRASVFGSDGHMIAMGGISCHFRREIMPYARFDIWTRLLSWDRKWLYIVSHLVKPGVVIPDDWVLQPWRTSTGKAKKEVREAEWKNIIYATSISKYVVKRGRMTIPPEQVLKDSDLLPPQPEEGPEKTQDPQWTWDLVEKERIRGLQIAEKFGALDTPGLHDEFFPWGVGDTINAESRLEGDSASQTIRLPYVEVLGQYKDLFL